MSKETLAKIRSKILVKLTEEAAKVDPSTTTVVALDWLNGRRTPRGSRTEGCPSGLNPGYRCPQAV